MQPKISALRNYELAGFSVERLMNLLTAVDHDVEIAIRRKRRSRRNARIGVIAPNSVCIAASTLPSGRIE